MQMQMQTRYLERSNSMTRGRRHLESDEKQQPERKRPALASVIAEALKVDSLHKLCSSLEPMLHRMVSEELECALAKLGPPRLIGRWHPHKASAYATVNRLNMPVSICIHVSSGHLLLGNSISFLHENVEAVAEIAKSSKHEACSMASKAEACSMFVISNMSDAEKRLKASSNQCSMFHCDDETDMQLTEPVESSTYFGDADGQRQGCENILFKLNCSRRYRRIVGCLGVSCLLVATPLLASGKGAAALVALHMVETVSHSGSDSSSPEPKYKRDLMLRFLCSKRKRLVKAESLATCRAILRTFGASVPFVEDEPLGLDGDDGDKISRKFRSLAFSKHKSRIRSCIRHVSTLPSVSLSPTSIKLLSINSSNHSSPALSNFSCLVTPKPRHLLDFVAREQRNGGLHAEYLFQHISATPLLGNENPRAAIKVFLNKNMIVKSSGQSRLARTSDSNNGNNSCICFFIVQLLNQFIYVDIQAHHTLFLLMCIAASPTSLNSPYLDLTGDITLELEYIDQLIYDSINHWGHHGLSDRICHSKTDPFPATMKLKFKSAFFSIGYGSMHGECLLEKQKSAFFSIKYGSMHGECLFEKLKSTCGEEMNMLNCPLKTGLGRPGKPFAEQVIWVPMYAFEESIRNFKKGRFSRAAIGSWSLSWDPDKDSLVRFGGSCCSNCTSFSVIIFPQRRSLERLRQRQSCSRLGASSRVQKYKPKD
ncbi:hypothetical protein RJ641_013945 [Dillenia turbinata]|uniref:Uncharacterized protein n=1 Tax=Dillenia turbinata TaxID=194707 RepID=A0AAN8WCX9_9MAGN